MSITKKHYIHLGVMFILTLLISLIPQFGQITSIGMKTLAIFVAVLYGWLTYDLILPSIYGFFGLTVLGIMSSADALSIGLGNSQVVSILAAMAFSVLSQWIDQTLVKRLFGSLLLITGFRELFYRPRKAR